MNKLTFNQEERHMNFVARDGIVERLDEAMKKLKPKNMTILLNNVLKLGLSQLEKEYK